MQRAIGALAAVAVLGLLLVGPMMLVMAAGTQHAVSERCIGSMDC